MRNFAALTLMLSFAGLSAQNYTQYVDPTIGTGDHGHVFLGANVPQGMVNAGPTQTKVGWDWCSGYHESCDSIVGFAQLHLSGTGCSDLGDVALMPVVGDVELSRLGIASPYRHETETTRPGYYSVLLDRFKINCEVTTTTRVALYQFTWQDEMNDRRLIVDLENGVGDCMLQARIEQVDDHTIVGYRISHGWTSHQEVYFELTTNVPIKEMQWDGKFGVLKFDETASTRSTLMNPSDESIPSDLSAPILVKVALSPTSYFNARNNRIAELNHWDFESVREAADAAWNKELGRIEVNMPSLKEMRTSTQVCTISWWLLRFGMMSTATIWAAIITRIVKVISRTIPLGRFGIPTVRLILWPHSSCATSCPIMHRRCFISIRNRANCLFGT